LTRIAAIALLAVLLLAVAFAQHVPGIPIPSLPDDSAFSMEIPSRFDLQRDDIRSFVDLMVAKHGFERSAVSKLLAVAERQPKILDAIARPAEKITPWWQYRARFLTPQRIREGREFLHQHRAQLAKAQAATGVPAEYIVAIIGVETFYGRVTGNWRVLDALATLGFDYPPRSAFFRDELESFLVLARDQKLAVDGARGSYAGAMGASQFNLFDDWDDVIASVGNYFHAFGWQPGAPVLLEANAPPELAATLDPRNLELTETLGSLRARGVKFDSAEPDTTPAMLLPAELESGLSVRLGLKNFMVITRYNRSIRYAMATHDLAQQIAALNSPLVP
jgi:membrane-bound lytic murein transglycosylase B